MRFLSFILKRVSWGIILLLAVGDVFAGEDGRAHFLLVEDPWPPYTLGQTGEVPESGLIVELMDELFTRIGHPVRMELYPWKRCIYMVKKQKADGLMLTVKTPEREEFAYFPEPFFINKIQFFHRSDKEFSWNNFSDLKGLTIGLVAGAKYSQEFQDAIKDLQLKVEIVSSIPINLNKLKAGRIDITPALDVVAAKIIADDNGFAGQFATAAKPLRITPMQMAISRSSALMNHSLDIEQVIKEMKKDGTVERIYRKYVPEIHSKN
jgi:polar amino acid transport system substrate-binding protein